jgi:precorrin-3B synthase
MTGAYARGACPGLSAPMVTGDGLLVRLMPAAPMSLEGFVGLCEAARAQGNGTMEISARGSLQIRGLTPLSAPLFAAAVAALDVDSCETVPIIADPLPDDPSALIDANSIAAALRRAIDGAGLSLAPKVSVVVDGGGRLDLDALTADIRLRALATAEGPKLQVALAGDAISATPIAVVAPDDAVDVVLVLLALIAARGPDARAADVLRGTIPLRSAASASAPEGPRADPIGQHRLRDSAFALGLGLGFGHAQADALAELARVASMRGASWARPAPGRALLLGPLNEANVSATKQAAEGLGFVTEAHDPRRRIVACPGAPACASGLIAARTLAAELVQHLPLSGDGIAIHVSGCAKGCAHHQAAPLTIVGTERGCGLIRYGSAQATPSAYADPADLAVELDRITRKTREAVNA